MIFRTTELPHYHGINAYDSRRIRVFKKGFVAKYSRYRNTHLENSKGDRIMQKKETALIICIILVIAVITVLSQRADSYKLQAEQTQTRYEELFEKHTAAAMRVAELEKELNDRNLSGNTE